MQAAYGRVDDADGLHQVTTVPMAHEHTDGSRHWFTATVPLERTGAFGYTVRVLPHSERMADPAELGVVDAVRDDPHRSRHFGHAGPMHPV